MKYTRKQREAAAELCAIAAEGREHNVYTLWTTWDAANHLDGRDLQWPDKTDPVRVLADNVVSDLFDDPGLSAFESARDLYLTAAAEILSGVKELRNDDR